MKIKNMFVFLLATASAVGCSTAYTYEDKKDVINIGIMKGPTGMGFAQFNHRLTAGEFADSNYTVTNVGTQDLITAGLSSKELDVAMLPANVAATIYNNKDAVDIQIIAINTFSALSLIADKSLNVEGLKDLAGQTIYLPGQGSTPEFVLRYLLNKNKITATLEFRSEGSEVVAGLKSGLMKVALLPEPAATTAITGSDVLVRSFRLADEWEKSEGEGKQFVTGVLVVRKAFIKNNADELEKFIKRYKESVEFITKEENIDLAAQYVVDLNINVPAVPVAKNSIPYAGISFVESKQMKKLLDSYYTALYNFDKNSIGGKVPSAGIYYL